LLLQKITAMALVFTTRLCVCIPKHPIIAKVLRICINNIEARSKTEDMLCVTGPGALGKAFRSVMQMMKSLFQTAIMDMAKTDSTLGFGKTTPSWSISPNDIVLRSLMKSISTYVLNQSYAHVHDCLFGTKISSFCMTDRKAFPRHWSCNTQHVFSLTPSFDVCWYRF